MDETSLTNSDLRITARGCPSGSVLAVEHVSKPRFGVQFHPESVATPRARSIAANFLDVVRGDGLETARSCLLSEKHVPTSTSSFVTRATRLDVVVSTHRPCTVRYSRRTAFWLDGTPRVGFR